MLGSSRNWQTAGRELAKRYHVLAPDLRNHGSSPHEGEMTYEAMMADVIGWLDAQGVTRATFMGHSMGGKVAMLLACRQRERVERLLAVDVAPKDYFWPEHRQEFAAMNELNLATLHSRAEAEELFESRVPGWAMRKFLLTNLERSEAGGWRWIVNLTGITAALPTLEKNPLRPGDHYDGSALFIAGGKSRYVDASDWPAVTRYFPGAKLARIAESGHNPHMEAREAFVRLVLEA